MCCFFWQSKRRVVSLLSHRNGGHLYSVRGRAEVARRAHNPKVVGSNPALATNVDKPEFSLVCPFLFWLKSLSSLYMDQSQKLGREDKYWVVCIFGQRDRKAIMARWRIPEKSGSKNAGFAKWFNATGNQ